MKQSELLRKQADMMDMADKYGIDDWRKLVKVEMHGSGRITTLDKTDCFAELPSWNYKSFALGVVEGKPVFEGDELYDRDGKKRNPINFCTITNQFKCEDTVWRTLDLKPPKPKTVMVELLVEDAEAATKWIDSVKGAMTNIGIACSEALESIKQS